MNLRKPQVQEKKKMQLVIIIDASTSMAHLRNETITGINEQIDQLRNTTNIDVDITLACFSGYGANNQLSHKYIFFNEPIADVPKITEDHYSPIGMTAMRDAVSLTIARVKSDTVADSYLVVIITDGEENNSRECSWEGLKSIIEECEADPKWTISYLGTNQDLFKLQQQTGIPIGNIGTWTYDATGTVNAFANISGYITMYAEATEHGTLDESKGSLYFNGTDGDIVNLSNTPKKG